MMARPKNVVAVTPGGRITIDQIIGWGSISRVPDRPVSGTKLLRSWVAHDLDPAHVPPTRKPVNVFQAACRSVEAIRRNGHNTEVKVDEIMEDGHLCVYQITRMVRDRDNMLIDHPKAMRVRFDKRTTEIEVDPLDPDTYDALAGLEADIRDYYDANGTKVPGQKVRNGLRALLRELGATNIIGSMWFVPKDEKGMAQRTLANIQAVLEELYGEDAQLYTLPLANDATQREMVERHFKLNVTELIEDQIGKVASVLNNGSYVRKDLLRNVIQERHRIGDLTGQYRTLCKSKLAETEDELKLLDQQIERLLQMKDETGGEDE